MIPAEIIIATSIGRKVFPVETLGKTPLVKWRSADPASSELEQVNKWFIRYGPTNWGLATGIESGLFVIDTDTKEGYDWVVSNGLTETYSVKTGGNTPEKLSYGYHFYFQHPGGDIRIKNSCRDLSPGVDIRGDGGYVLIPPSMTEMPYYVANQREVAIAPQWLIERITKTEAQRIETLPSANLTESDLEYGRNIYRKACRDYREYIESTDSAENNENIELNNLAGLAGNMIAAGCLDEDYAFNLAREAGDKYFKANRKAFMATWKSGLKWGLTDPWAPLGPEDVGFAGGIPVPAPPTVGLESFDDVEMKPIRWLWPGWLPLGKFVIYAGPGGVGKSSVTFSWASIISQGGKWPDGLPCKQGRVLIWSGEDDVADTIKPRLTAMGADMKKIDFIRGSHGQGFDPARDFAQLKVRLKPGQVSLLIIDPIVSAILGDGHKANDVRRSLQAIVDFGNDLDCCVVGITHFNKGSAGKNPTERVTGSQAFTALSRITIVGQKDPDTQECIIARSKSNISVDQGGLKYRIEPTTVQNGIETTRIQWLEGVEGSAQDLICDLEPGDEKISERKVDSAREFLKIALSQQPLPLKQLLEQGGFSKATLMRAKEQLPIRMEREGQKWIWSMPFGEMPSE